MRRAFPDHATLGLLSATDYRHRLLVLERGRDGAERAALAGQVRFHRGLLVEANDAVLRHLRDGSIHTSWGRRCLETLAWCRGQYLQARQRERGAIDPKPPDRSPSPAQFPSPLPAMSPRVGLGAVGEPASPG